MSWEEQINSAIGASPILGTCQVHVYNRVSGQYIAYRHRNKPFAYYQEGVLYGSAGKSDLPKPEAETIKAAAKAFSCQDGKDAIRSGGLNIGGEKYRLIRDEDHIIMRKKEEGAVFTNTTKEYIIVGMTPNLKTQQGALIGICEKAQSWLSGQQG